MRKYIRHVVREGFDPFITLRFTLLYFTKESA